MGSHHWGGQYPNELVCINCGMKHSQLGSVGNCSPQKSQESKPLGGDGEEAAEEYANSKCGSRNEHTAFHRDRIVDAVNFGYARAKAEAGMRTNDLPQIAKLCEKIAALEAYLAEWKRANESLRWICSGAEKERDSALSEAKELREALGIAAQAFEKSKCECTAWAVGDQMHPADTCDRCTALTRLRELIAGRKDE